ncbi:MAG: O-antigen ligase family protein [Chitinophagaceae bacterium]
MKSRREQFLFFSMMAMMAALFVSRAMLSVCMMLFVVLSFFHKDIKAHFRHFFSSPLLWGMSLLFVLPLVSGLWSTDKQQWLYVLQPKLALLFLPLAFAGPFSFTRKHWELLAYFFIALVTAGTIWSMLQYIMDLQAVNQSYLQAKSIITPLKNDRVRFSWLVAVAVLLSGKIGWDSFIERKSIKWLWLVIILWLLIFLHVLAMRTGLISLYIIMAATACWLLIKKIKWKYAVVILLLLPVLPYMAYRLLPSFHNRINYFIYDYSYFKKMEYLPGGNDAVRVISLNAGWDILNKNPIAGVGAGDVLSATKEWYEVHYPQVRQTDIIYPSSEWLLYGDACGWPGFLLFTCIMCIPFFVVRKYKLVWITLNLIAAFSLLFDVGLEVQFGVFIYSFIVLWWWKWLAPQNKIIASYD